MEHRSKAKEIAGYSFLVIFANDTIIDEGELRFLEKLALEDGEVDDAERSVLRAIFSRVNRTSLSPDVAAEIDRFRAKHSI
jgi:hypothetical protein